MSSWSHFEYGSCLCRCFVYSENCVSFRLLSMIKVRITNIQKRSPALRKTRQLIFCIWNKFSMNSKKNWKSHFEGNRCEYFYASVDEKQLYTYTSRIANVKAIGKKCDICQRSSSKGAPKKWMTRVGVCMCVKNFD